MNPDKDKIQNCTKTADKRMWGESFIWRKQSMEKLLFERLGGENQEEKIF